MRLAPYYQALLKKGQRAAKSLEPITFIGMFDSGVDYLFTLFIPLLGSGRSKVSIVSLDLSGVTSAEGLKSEVVSGLSELIHKRVDPDERSILSAVRQSVSKKPMVWVLYTGQEGETDPWLFMLLNRLRNVLGWKFSYCIFTTTRMLGRKELRGGVYEKVLNRNIVSVLPLDAKNAGVVLANYEERYGKKVAPEQKKNILTYAGGNPGLIKSLYLQARDTASWRAPDAQEDSLRFRIAGIQGDLTPALGEESRFRYGYMTAKGMFTPLIRSENTDENNLILAFTKSQRSVFSYLQAHPGELVSKDTIAQVLWGESWTEKYSDWAIDQTMSSLRGALRRMRHKGKIITKKGEGMVFVPEAP